MRKRIFAFVTLALAASLVPATPAAAAGSFTFYGSGFGHGLGMSQWGAYGLALRGWTSKPILTHFYSNTAVARAVGAPSSLRVGLAQNRTKISLSALDGPVTLRLDDHRSGTLVGQIPAGVTWTVVVAGTAYRVHDENGNRVGGQDWGGPSSNLYASYGDVGARVQVPQAGATYNHGYIEFNLYACGDGTCVERLVLRIAPQSYLYGLGEVPSSWPMAAMRAQAIAARSYAFAKAKLGQHRPGCNCALYDTSADQVYVGWNKEAGPDGARWVSAVNRTDGQVVRYQGITIEAFYTSSSGGYTENNENVWGGAPIAWLRGVCDPGDYTRANPNRVWSVTFSAADTTSALRPYTGAIGTVLHFSQVQRGVSGRIESATVAGANGSSSVTGTELRAALGLRDDRVWINRNVNVTGAIRATYDNLMCRPGLPVSTKVKVEGGSAQRFTVGGIYQNAGAALTVWLKGPTYDEYRGVHGPSGPLRLPTTRRRRVTGVGGCAGGGCTRQGFAGGWIYWKTGIGAHALWGRVLTTFLDRGGARGPLGFPTSRVVRAGNGTRSATFEHGAISCPSGAACRVS